MTRFLPRLTFPGVAYAYLDDYRTRTEYFFEDATIEGPARKMEVDPGVTAAPFYAIGPIKPFNIFSGGGLKVDREMHVLDQQGRPIPHLYAAGVNGESGVFLGGHGHHLAWAFGTGMIAGRNAASETA